MKTFKDYLRENFDEDDPASGDLKDLIRAECPGFIKRAGNKGFLYRGMDRLGSYEGRFRVGEQTCSVYRKKVRKDRYPMSTNKYVHKALGEWFTDKFGFDFRSGAVFCFGEGGRDSAEGYSGKRTIIFPVGKFSYCWSPIVNDLYGEVDAVLNKGNRISDKFALPGSSTKMDMDKLDDYMKQWEYTNNNLDKAVMSDKEIMIDCDEILVIQYYGLETLKLIHQELGTEGIMMLDPGEDGPSDD